MKSRKIVAFAVVVSVGSAVRFAAAVPDGGTSSSPTSWATRDLRVPSRDDVLHAQLRLGHFCGYPVLGPSLTGGVIYAANVPTITPELATAFACALGAPDGASCDDVLTCAGANGPDVDNPVCDGSRMRVRSRKGKRAAVSCPTFGQGCYVTPVGGLCGDGLCENGETYSCDGDTIVICQQGIRVRIPCGNGMTCGRTLGSKVVDCIGKGGECTADSCAGNVLTRCQRDGFGKGTSERIDCSTYGLVCASGVGKDKIPFAGCAAPSNDGSSASCSVETDAASCINGALHVCIANRWATISCTDLGLSGTCHVTGQSFHCGP